MRAGRKAVPVWKGMLLAAFFIITSAGLAGCGRDNVQESAADTYGVENRDASDEKSVETSGRMADAAELSYYNSLDELTKPGGGLDISSWEGDDAIDKWSRRIMYWWTCFYRAVKRHVVEIMAVNTLIGAMLAVFATKNKQVRRFGIFNLCIYLNSVVLVFVIAVGLVNHFYTV